MANTKWRNIVSKVRLPEILHDQQLIKFHRFAEYQDNKRELPVECIVIIVISSEQCINSLSLNMIVQNSIGQDIYKRQCKLNIFLLLVRLLMLYL